MNEEMLNLIREMALRSKRSTWWQPYEMHQQCGSDDAEFIAALSPEIVLELLYEIERRHEMQAALLACGGRIHELICETNKYAAEISMGKSATIKMAINLDAAQSQSDRRAALLRQYHLGHKTPAFIEAVEKELK